MWSQELPTAPGLYWYRMALDGNTYNVKVFINEIDGALSIGGESVRPIQGLLRWWWSEFLPPPVESD